MRTGLSIIGIVLIILGILFLAYQGISYTKREKVAQLGDLQLTANKEETIVFPPLLGGLTLVAGVVLVVVSRIGKPK